jgi:hypothetical protein
MLQIILVIANYLDYPWSQPWQKNDAEIIHKFQKGVVFYSYWGQVYVPFNYKPNSLLSYKIQTRFWATILGWTLKAYISSLYSMVLQSTDCLETYHNLKKKNITKPGKESNRHIVFQRISQVQISVHVNLSFNNSISNVYVAAQCFFNIYWHIPQVSENLLPCTST